MNFLKKLSLLSIKIALLYVIVQVSFGLVKHRSDTEFAYLYSDTTNSVVEVFQSTNILHSGLGSGVFISPSFVMTNNHVVEENGDNIVAIKTIDHTYFGEVVYRNSALDVAVIKVEAPIGKPVKVGDSSKLMIGDKIFSIGSSVGLTNTLGVGYLTAVERFVPLAPYIHIMQISTGIAPGNSGGGVFNIDGELVGISYAAIDGVSNIGFMIPINYLRFLIEKYNY